MILASFHVFGNFFTNILQSITPRGKIVGIENVSHKILNNVRYFKVNLDLPFNLKFQYMKWLKIENFACFHVFGNIFAYMSRSMRPRRKIVVIENVSGKISYKVGHSRVSLDLLFSLEIH